MQVGVSAVPVSATQLQTSPVSSFAPVFPQRDGNTASPLARLVDGLDLQQALTVTTRTEVRDLPQPSAMRRTGFSPSLMI